MGVYLFQCSLVHISINATVGLLRLLMVDSAFPYESTHA